MVRKIYVDHWFHWDPVYRFTQRDGGMPRNILTTVYEWIQLLKEDPDENIGFFELDYLKPYWDIHPEERDFIKRMIQEDGRIDIMGGCYTPADEKIVSGEGLIRNMVYGKFFQEDVLGYKDPVFFPIDSFGDGPQRPQLLVKSGFIACNLRGGRWMALDGSKIACGSGAGVPVEVDSEGIPQNIQEQVEALVERGGDRPYLITAGGHVAPRIGDFVRAWNRSHEDIKVSPSGGTRAFFRHLKEHEETLPIFARDRAHDCQGTGTTRIEIKQANRLVENTVLSAEKFATLANLLGARYPEQALDKAWRHLVFSQHHDYITGLINNHSFMDGLDGYRDALELSVEVLDNALAYIGEAIDTRGPGIPISVFNPCAWRRTDVCVASLDFGDEEVERFALKDEGGQSVPFQALKMERDQAGWVRKAQVLFVAEEVPSLGYKVYHVCAQEEQEQVEDGTLLGYSDEAGRYVIENGYYRVVLDERRGGGMVSLFDKENDKEVINPTNEGVGNELILLEDCVVEDFYNAWIFNTTDRRSFSRNFPAEVKMERGPVMAKATVVGEVFGPRGEVIGRREQEVILYRGIKRIDFHTYLLGPKGTNYLVKVAFPTDVKGAVPVYEERFGAVARNKSRRYLDFRGDGTIAGHHKGLQTHVYQKGAEYLSYQWMDYSHSLLLTCRDEKGRVTSSYPVFLPKLIPDGSSRPYADLLMEALTKKGILPGGSFNIYMGNSETDAHIALFIEELCEEDRRTFERRLAQDGYAYLFLFDEGKPQLLVVSENSERMEEAVGRLCRDIEERGEIALPCEADVSDRGEVVEDYGVALINYGNVGNSVEAEGTMTMSLMRSLTCHMYRADSTEYEPVNFFLEEWNHGFRYALYPHRGNWREAGTHRVGYEFNNPLIAKQVARHRGALPEEMSFVEVIPENVVLVALKPKGYPQAAYRLKERCHGAKGMVARVYEAWGKEADFRCSFFRPISQVWRTNMLEEVEEALEGEALSFKMTPFSIETFLFVPEQREGKSSEVRLGREVEPVQPIYSRYWEYNLGPPPMGNAPVVVTLHGGPLEQGINQVRVGVVNDYVDAEVSGEVHLMVPDGWEVRPQRLSYEIEALGYRLFDASVMIPPDCEAGALKARIEQEGQVFEDILTLGTPKLEKRIGLKDGRIFVKLSNPHLCEVEGEIRLMTSLVSWPVELAGFYSMISIGPRAKGFAVSAKGETAVPFDLEVPRDTKEGSYWAVAKVMYNGEVDYTEPAWIEV